MPFAGIIMDRKVKRILARDRRGTLVIVQFGSFTECPFCDSVLMLLCVVFHSFLAFVFHESCGCTLLQCICALVLYMYQITCYCASVRDNLVSSIGNLVLICIPGHSAPIRPSSIMALQQDSICGKERISASDPALLRWN